MDRIVDEVLAEVRRVDISRGLDLDTAWGSGRAWAVDAREARAAYDELEACGLHSYAAALREEVYEALAEDDAARLRAALVQVASLAMRWIRAIDARGT